ncbi:LOW QUALITY PROTEIN: hypothetical protein U9M48_019626 [Paspalum notatum var. saurae]|uniref:CCHC-type domain-containing protein n=1 Tax=Paspalum notatum var. saurae TaxID=547442 RepID=A0AAQ3TE31_PASNO
MVNTRQGQTSGQQPHDAPPPPELATLVVQQAELIRMMAEERQAQGQQRAREHQPRGITYQDFEGLRPPVFTTCPEPLAADDWLRTIESKFTLLPGLTEQEKARYFRAPRELGMPRSRLCSSGITLSHGRSSVRLPGPLHPGKSYGAKQREFRELKQGTRTVMQYVQTFIQLSQYSPADVADDPSRVTRLLQGFDPTLQTHLGRRYQSFSELVDTALDMENRLRVANEDQKRKRQASSAQGPSQKQKANYQQQPRYVIRPNPSGWFHRAPRRRRYPAYRAPARLPAPRAPTAPGPGNPCFNCGKIGHFSGECRAPRGIQGPTPTGGGRASKPKGNAPRKGQVHYIHLEQIPVGEPVLAGTFSVNGHPTVVLFDSGATHTFISQSYASKHGIKTSCIKESYNISAPGNPINTNLIVKRLLLSIGGEDFVISPVVLPHQGIDVILGMNWMNEHHAVLDIGSMTVQLKSNVSGKVLKIHIPNQKHIEPTVNATELQEIKKIPVVCEFPDVFPKELPGLPPDRNVEFSIELVPGTAPVSKRPYRMAPDELKELKTCKNNWIKVSSALARHLGGARPSLSKRKTKVVNGYVWTIGL